MYTVTPCTSKCLWPYLLLLSIFCKKCISSSNTWARLLYFSISCFMDVFEVASLIDSFLNHSKLVSRNLTIKITNQNENEKWITYFFYFCLLSTVSFCISDEIAVDTSFLSFTIWSWNVFRMLFWYLLLIFWNISVKLLEKFLELLFVLVWIDLRLGVFFVLHFY